MERTRSAGGVSILKPPAGEAMVDTVFLRRRDSFATSALREFLARATQTFATGLTNRRSQPRMRNASWRKARLTHGMSIHSTSFWARALWA